MTDFTEDRLNDLLKGGYAKAVGEDKETFIAFYAYLFNDNDPCPSCPHKLSSYWDRLAREGKSRLKLNLEKFFKKLVFGCSVWEVGSSSPAKD